MNILDELNGLKWHGAPRQITLAADALITDLGVHSDHTITLIGDADAVAHLRSQVDRKTIVAGWREGFDAAIDRVEQYDRNRPMDAPGKLIATEILIVLKEMRDSSIGGGV
jgi:hypothetical protein